MHGVAHKTSKNYIKNDCNAYQFYITMRILDFGIVELQY